MVYQERNVWSSLVVTVIALAAYVVIVLKEADGGPLTAVDWVPIMFWTIIGSIAASIVVSIVWGIVAGMREPAGVGARDIRDRDIARMGTGVEQAFVAIAGVGVLVLCAVRADWFWIADTMFFGFAVAAVVGGVARVVACRRGL
ncbi:hypothetical protein [Microbacterium candidum]|uniref:DUF2178 domain-containing protein n=1 Tax=Microbacterium candidum TaxID=3041922 RepID=A0ABT7MXU5_9MICO|nr:hypothetical protein [Microbacterium sp. ASV49]MDL9979278.1 hypothetical protein [Microbacterium sp. ASV49]